MEPCELSKRLNRLNDLLFFPYVTIKFKATVDLTMAQSTFVRRVRGVSHELNEILGYRRRMIWFPNDATLMAFFYLRLAPYDLQSSSSRFFAN